MSEPLKFAWLKGGSYRVGDILDWEEVTIMPDDPRYAEYAKYAEWLKNRPTAILKPLKA